ncbi:hypothetical protein G6F40_016066 [Rhizopus arrhizus]|nr:hypothetical protein G6F40_016066 [Rhizopus arrhizus]
MVGRHDHQHGRALVLRAPAARRAYLGAEVRGRDDDGHAARRVVQDGPREHLAFFVRQHELFGKVRQDAQAVHPRVDHEVHRPLLAGQVQFARLGKRGGHHGEDAAVARRGGRGGRCHPRAYSMMLKSFRYSVFSVSPRPGLLSSRSMKPSLATGSPSKM